jgi:hypothetical protein
MCLTITANDRIIVTPFFMSYDIARRQFVSFHYVCSYDLVTILCTSQMA